MNKTEQNDEARMMTDLDAIAGATKDVGKFLRVKGDDPLTLSVADPELMVLPNRWGRDEFRLLVYVAERVGDEWYVHPDAMPQPLALTKRGAYALAQAFLAAGHKKLDLGVIFQIARVGSGFDTRYAARILPKVPSSELGGVKKEVENGSTTMTPARKPSSGSRKA